MAAAVPSVEGPILPSPPLAFPEISAQGYCEEEFFLSGAANVYGPREDADRSSVPWRNSSFTHHELDFSTLAKADVPYATRILVRRPEDEARFNGVVYIEPLHVLRDRGVGWRTSRAWIMRTGAVWIGVTASSGWHDKDRGPLGGLAYLRTTEPERYGPLSLDDGEASLWPLLRAPSAGSDLAGLMSEVDWKGESYNVAFARVVQEMYASYSHSPDVLSGLGKLLKTDAASGPLGGWQVDRVYVTGGSLTGKYWNMFLQGGLHDRVGDRPVFDGYMVLVTGPPPGLKVPADAPVVNVQSEKEAVASCKLGVPIPDDSDTPRRRYYEIAGTGHRFTGSDPDSNADDWAGSGNGDLGPLHMPHNTRPNAPLLHAIWHNLDRWVVDGVPMPTEAPITRDASSPDGIARDGDGNALGGIRGPWITVPDARYVPHCQAHPNEGAIEVFTAEQRAAHGLSATAFVERIGARADELVGGGWLRPEDAGVYTDHAKAVSSGW